MSVHVEVSRVLSGKHIVLREQDARNSRCGIVRKARQLLQLEDTRYVDVVHKTSNMWPAGRKTVQRSIAATCSSRVFPSCTCESTSVPAMCSRPPSWAESGRNTHAKHVTKANVRKDRPCGPIIAELTALGLKTGRYVGDSNKK